MQESREDTSSDKVLILPLSEESKKITQTLSNEKAMKVLEVLTDKAMSATDVAAKLGMPLTTVKYNIDSLVEADLLKVKETKWSKKGREIKIYEPVQKFIVVAPGSMKKDKNSVINMLKKYLGLVAGALFAATGLEMLTRYSNLGFGAAPMQEAMSAKTYDEITAPMSFDNATEPGIGEEMMAERFVEDIPMDVDMENEAFPTDSMPGAGEQEIMAHEIPLEEMEVPELPESGITAIPEESLADSVSTYAPNESVDGGLGITADIQGGDTDIVSHVPAEGMAAASDQATGLIPELLSHVSVWFLFGCLFIIAFLFIREVYYRKKDI